MQLPLRFSHNLLAYFNGTLLLSHAIAVSLQPQSIGLLQRYTVALSRNCRFTSAVILRPTSAPHRCVPSRLRFIRPYSSGVHLETSRRLRRPAVLSAGLARINQRYTSRVRTRHTRASCALPVTSNKSTKVVGNTNCIVLENFYVNKY
jgi:hypothetical protein